MLHYVEVLAWLALALCLCALLTRKWRFQLAAKGIQGQMECAYIPRHEHRLVDPSDFAYLDYGFYDQGRAFLGQYGFRFLADEEDVTLKGTFADARTFIRIMLGDDASPRIWRGESRRACPGDQLVGGRPRVTASPGGAQGGSPPVCLCCSPTVKFG
jgi:hypothetical protein